MLIFRWLATLLLLASAVSFAFYLGTGQPRYKRWGFIILKWTVIAGPRGRCSSGRPSTPP